MKIDFKPLFLLNIDKYLGVPLCFMFDAFNKVQGYFFSQKDFYSKKVLIVKFAEMGATIHAYSTIRNLQLKVGEKNVYFVCFKGSEEILFLMKLFSKDQILVLDFSNPWRFLWDCLAARSFCRSRKIDTILDFEFFSRAGAILSYFLGGFMSRRIGLVSSSKKKPYCGDLYNDKINYNEHTHISKIYESLAKRVLQEKEYENIPVPLLHFSGVKVNKRLSLGLGEGLGDLGKTQVVVINPSFQDLLPLRAWPASYYKELINKLLRTNINISVLIVGKKNEVKFSQQFCSEFLPKRVYNLVGQSHSLMELMYVLNHADVFVSSDSGPIHFSRMVKDIRVVSLFGPETPELFSPRIENSIEITAGLNCSPCFSVYTGCYSRCKKNVCLEEITVDRVYNTVLKILKERNG
jgi:ADP-heptose:LPS heptosyltransferase